MFSFSPRVVPRQLLIMIYTAPRRGAVLPGRMRPNCNTASMTPFLALLPHALLCRTAPGASWFGRNRPLAAWGVGTAFTCTETEDSPSETSTCSCRVTKKRGLARLGKTCRTGMFLLRPSASRCTMLEEESLYLYGAE